jgi:hypothetical protein
MRALLDHLKPLGLKILAARRWQSQLTAGGKRDSSLAPCVRVEHQRQSRAPAAADEALKAAMVIGVAMRDDDRAQVTHWHLEHVEVASHGVRREARVVEHGAPVAVPLDADQRGETMLSNQLLSRAEVPRLVANHALLAGHQHVEEVVDHDCDFDAINRREHALILRQQPAPSIQLRTKRGPRIQTPGPPHRGSAGEAVPEDCSGTPPAAACSRARLLVRPPRGHDAVAAALEPCQAEGEVARRRRRAGQMAQPSWSRSEQRRTVGSLIKTSTQHRAGSPAS